jgi:lysophospholipase L1-like esterase
MSRLAACAFIFMTVVTPAALRAEESLLPQEWDYAAAMKAVAAKGAGRNGVVLHIGDSITYASPYAAWARAGEGRADADRQALKWMHAGANDDTDGWHLATFDHPEGGRSYTACGGIRADEMLAGGRQRMPKLTDLLDEYKPQAVVLMLGTNDASAGRPVESYRRDMESILDAMLSRGIVPILSTIPPHVHRRALAGSYNDALRALGKRLHLPLIDFEREILTRRQADWDGTLMGRGDVHPTAAQGGATPTSAPSADNLRNSGYLLRGWLSVKKIAEVKRTVFDPLEP